MEAKPIDVAKVLRLIWQRKRLLAYVFLASGLLSSLIIIQVPRYYRCSVALAPEMTSSSMSSIASIASSFGVDLAGKMGSNQDAISPDLYPDLIKSTDFMVSMFPVEITTKDSSLTTNYYTYLFRHQKAAFWSTAFYTVKGWFKREKSAPYNGTDTLNAFRLSKDQTDVVYAMEHNIKCSVDKKTSVISITVTDQDPVVCATIANVVKGKLQEAITAYRTKKARLDLEYVNGLLKDAESEYETARDEYASYCDAHTDVSLESVKLKMEDMENNLQILFNNYSSLSTQYQTAKAKVQEKTPAFTTLQSATVPIKPAGPKRMIIVACFVLLCCVATGIRVVVKNKD